MESGAASRRKPLASERGEKEDPLYPSRWLLLQGEKNLKKKLRDLPTDLNEDGEVTIASNGYQESRLVCYVPHNGEPQQL